MPAQSLPSPPDAVVMSFGNCALSSSRMTVIDTEEGFVDRSKENETAAVGRFTTPPGGTVRVPSVSTCLTETVDGSRAGYNPPRTGTNVAGP